MDRETEQKILNMIQSRIEEFDSLDIDGFLMDEGLEDRTQEVMHYIRKLVVKDPHEMQRIIDNSEQDLIEVVEALQNGDKEKCDRALKSAISHLKSLV